MKQVIRLIKFFSLTYQAIFPRFFCIMSLINLIDFFVKQYIYAIAQDTHKVGVFCLHGNQLILLTCLMLVLGYIYASRDYSGYLKIRAERSSYLIVFLLWSTGLCMLTMMANRIEAVLIESLVIRNLSLPHRVYCATTVLQEVIVYILGIQGGFLIGALYYRLRKRSFIVMISSAFLLLMSYALQGENILDLFAFLSRKSESLLITEGWIVIGCMCLSSLLLLRAPSISYAHDLL